MKIPKTIRVAPIWDEQMCVQIRDFRNQNRGCACRCASRTNRCAQVHKQVSLPHLHWHIQMFIITFAFFRPIFIKKLPLCVQMFTYKADFAGKVGLKNEEVKMNESVNR